VPNANLASFGLTAIATAEAALIDEMAAIVQSKTAPIVKPHRNLRWRRIIERARFMMITAHYQLFRPILSTLLSELTASAGWFISAIAGDHASSERSRKAAAVRAL
jgi:hypothetical protein